MDNGDICIWVNRGVLLLDLVDLLDMRDFAVMEDQGQKDLRGLGLVGRALEVLVIMVQDPKDPMGRVCKGLDMGLMGIMDTMARVVVRVDQADQVGMEDGRLMLNISSIFFFALDTIPKFCPNPLSGFEVIGKSSTCISSRTFLHIF
jgi:hypothetical protein